MGAFEFIRIIVGQGPTATFGETLDTFTNYEVTTSIWHPAHFSFNLNLTTGGGGSDSRQSLRDRVKSLMKSTRPDTVVRIEQGERRTLLFRGIIGRQFIGGDRGGETIQITGRDAGQVLQDNEARPELKVSGKTLPQLADQILSRYKGKGIPFNVAASADANRDIITGRQKNLSANKTVNTRKGKATVTRGNSKTGGVPIGFASQTSKDARPHPGEREWAFLERHARNLGVLMYMSAEGDLIFEAPDYSQPSLYDLQRLYDCVGKTQNNILSGGRAFDTDNAATAVHIYGHTEGRGEKRHQVTATITTVDSEGKRVPTSKAKATNARPVAGKAAKMSVWPRERTLRDSHAKTGDQAKKLATRELAKENANFETFEYTLADHQSSDEVIYAISTMAHVKDEVCDFDGRIYITERSIRKSRTEINATTTTIKGVPEGAIVL